MCFLAIINTFHSEKGAELTKDLIYLRNFSTISVFEVILFSFLFFNRVFPFSLSLSLSLFLSFFERLGKMTGNMQMSRVEMVVL